MCSGSEDVRRIDFCITLESNKEEEEEDKVWG